MKECSISVSLNSIWWRMSVTEITWICSTVTLMWRHKRHNKPYKATWTPVIVPVCYISQRGMFSHLILPSLAMVHLFVSINMSGWHLNFWISTQKTSELSLYQTHDTANRKIKNLWCWHLLTFLFLSVSLQFWTGTYLQQIYLNI